MGLFKPAWRSSNEEKALRAVDRMTRQRELFEVVICKDGVSSIVRHKALEKLTDSILLADVAENSMSIDLRIAAVNKLSDDSLLASIPKDHHEVVSAVTNRRIELINTITNQSELLNIVKNEGNLELRWTAAKKLNDPLAKMEFFRDIALNHYDGETRLRAAVELGDPHIIENIALNDDNEFVRYAAVEIIENQTVLIAIAENDNKSMVRLLATERIKDTSERERHQQANCSRNDHYWEVLETRCGNDIGGDNAWILTREKCRCCGKIREAVTD